MNDGPQYPGQPTMAGNLAEIPAWYDVQVKKVSNGFIIQVGCKTFVTKTWDEAAIGIAMYFDDPKAARQKFCEDERPTKVKKNK